MNKITDQIINRSMHFFVLCGDWVEIQLREYLSFLFSTQQKASFVTLEDKESSFIEKQSISDKGEIRDVNILIPEKNILKREITLPDVRKGKLLQILHYKNAELFPLAFEELYFSLNKKQQLDNKMAVFNVYAVKRSIVDTFLSKLKNTQNLRKITFLPEGKSDSIDITPFLKRRFFHKKDRQNLFAFSTTTISVALLFLSLAYFDTRIEKAINQLTLEQTENLLPAIDAALAERQQGKHLLELIESLPHTEKIEKHLDIVENLSGRLSPPFWVYSYKYQNGILNLQIAAPLDEVNFPEKSLIFPKMNPNKILIQPVEEKTEEALHISLWEIDLKNISEEES